MENASGRRCHPVRSRCAIAVRYLSNAHPQTILYPVSCDRASGRNPRSRCVTLGCIEMQASPPPLSPVPRLLRCLALFVLPFRHRRGNEGASARSRTDPPAEYTPFLALGQVTATLEPGALPSRSLTLQDTLHLFFPVNIPLFVDRKTLGWQGQLLGWC